MTDITGLFQVKTIPQPGSPGQLGQTPARAYNPSLAWFRDRLIIGYRISTMTRCSRRHIDFSRRYSGEMPPFLNSTGVGVLDAGDACVHQPRQIDAGMPNACPWSIGYEDPRIFTFAGRLFLLVAHRNEKWTFGLSIIHLGDNLASERVVAVTPDEGSELHQKNWNPFVAEDELYCVSSIVPHQVYRIDVNSGEATLVHQTMTTRFADLSDDYYVRGGAGYLRIGDRFVGLCRIALKQDPDANTNDYRCIAYSFEATPPFSISGRSAPFVVAGPSGPDRPLQMVTGIAETGDDVLVGYGENDCDLKLARIGKEQLVAAIES